MSETIYARPGVVAALLAITASCQLGGSQTGPSVRPVVETQASKRVVLGEGDVLEIRVFREPDLAGIYQVNSDGDIDFPLIGKVRLNQKIVDEVESEIRVRLADGYLKSPQVSVFVQKFNSQKVHVLGQVQKPGSFPFEPGMTVIQAVAVAGGFGKLAATNRVSVTRVVDGSEHKYVVAAGDIGSGEAPNFKLDPGDIVYVPEAIF